MKSAPSALALLAMAAMVGGGDSARSPGVFPDTSRKPQQVDVDARERARRKHRDKLLRRKEKINVG